MKKDYRELELNGSGELYKLEKFIEEICDFHNINNEYFGNILLASTEATNIMMSLGRDSGKGDLVVSFEKKTKGFTFKIRFESYSGQEETDFSIEREVRKLKLTKELYIIKALADEVTISIKGEMIILTFYVSSMNYEKSIERINKLKEYWVKKSAIVRK